MAVELITRTWCDVHLEAKDEHVEGTNYKYGAREIDLCVDCAGPFVEAARLVEEYGRRDRQDETARPACPECGKTYMTTARVKEHARRVHGQGADALAGDPTPYRCEECGKEFTRPQGLGAHRRIHKVESNG